MPPVNWEAFEGLPGGAQHNFETLCRALIRRHYARCGAFVSRAAQPGVEFHLKLRAACSLGSPGRWYGWQCRWYDLPGGRALGTTRRNKIKEAIETTERGLPHLTDWVLWTRRPLTAGDQVWFYGLQTQMQLHAWTALEVEEHLSGDAEILRRTYFGELVLLPNHLADEHGRAVAPIKHRWRPELHQAVDAERELRAMLGETNAWDGLRALAHDLNDNGAALQVYLTSLPVSFFEATNELVETACALASALDDVCALLDRGDFDSLRERLSSPLAGPASALLTLSRRLRAARHPAALTATNTLADVRLSRVLWGELDVRISSRLVAVQAEAGCGKTELAAQLTAAARDRPAGILLHGSFLQANHSLDDLARRLVIQGDPVPSMVALVAAVDAAGRRVRRRLPIVIDGLNEAEDPRVWKGLLASLYEVLADYPYVLFVCTLRTAFAGEALPQDIVRLEIPDFGRDTGAAIARYFAFYRINSADADLPMDLLSHPLTLRLFCEVTNPSRDRTVGIEAMPTSLTSIFERYLEQAIERIAELAPRTRRYYEQDVRTAFDKIGVTLWEEGTRSLDLEALRCSLQDDGRPWGESIVRALEHEGVLFRVPGEAPAGSRVVAAYDALAGHLVADAILRRHGWTGFAAWVRNPVVVTALAGPLADRHPLSSDVLQALVGLVPRRLRRQLWPLLDEPLRTPALRATAELEGSYIDADTVRELAVLVAQPPADSRDLLDRLRNTRGAPTHPLNAAFLDSVLRAMSVADRDMRWSEWVRRRREDILGDLLRLEKRWRETIERSPDDRLQAQWAMWTLTSTVRPLRDQATRTLYWFGRGNPSGLFELTLDAFAISDPYVVERLLAASYGVVMAHQLPVEGFISAFCVYLRGIRDALTQATAAHPTNHWLLRQYVQGTVSFALTYCPDAVPEGMEVGGRVPFASGPEAQPIEGTDSRADEVGGTLHMDFENYTLGRLFAHRRNYDMSHPGHQSAVAHVRGTVWALGWRESALGANDDQIAHHALRRHEGVVERYGKKYAWIGFYTFAGMLDDQGQLPRGDERLSDVDIDPSFPEPPAPAPIALPIWARSTPADDRRWIRSGIVRVPDDLLCPAEVGSEQGPWIAVYAHLNSDQQAPGRRVWGLLTALLVAPDDVDRLVNALETRRFPGRWWIPEVSSDYYTFAGEIPWNPAFAASHFASKSAGPYSESVGLDDDTQVEAEILVHRYDWETYHSGLNQAGGALVPSRLFSTAFDLRGIPQSFGQMLPDGTTAAVSCAAPAGFGGHVLYLREDLVYQYAGGRSLVWFFWGERELDPHPAEHPKWLSAAVQSHSDVWRLIRRGEELSAIFTTAQALP